VLVTWRWLLRASIPLSFGLMTVEFGRFFVGLDSMHSGQAGISRIDADPMTAS
jgi:hypothetical protein